MRRSVFEGLSETIQQGRELVRETRAALAEIRGAQAMHAVPDAEAARRSIMVLEAQRDSALVEAQRARDARENLRVNLHIELGELREALAIAHKTVEDLTAIIAERDARIRELEAAPKPAVADPMKEIAGYLLDLRSMLRRAGYQ